MTRPLPFTEAAIRRAILAVQKAGVEVGAVSVAPDGTVTVHRAGNSVAPAAPVNHNAPSSEWEDIKA